MCFLSVVRIRPFSFIAVRPVFCVVMNPLQTSYRPLHHLAFCRGIGQQEKRRFRGEEDRLIFVSSCCTTKSNQCVPSVLAIRKGSTFSISIGKNAVFVVPENRTGCQTLRTLFLLIHVDTVVTCVKGRYFDFLEEQSYLMFYYYHYHYHYHSYLIIILNCLVYMFFRTFMRICSISMRITLSCIRVMRPASFKNKSSQ